MRLMILYLQINQDVLDMVPPSAMTGDKENRGQGDLCVCSALGSEDSDLPGALQSWAVECYCGEHIYDLGWEQERDRMVMSWAQRLSEEVKLLRRKLRLGGLIVKQGRGDGWVWSAARAHVLGSWPCFIRGLC